MKEDPDSHSRKRRKRSKSNENTKKYTALRQHKDTTPTRLGFFEQSDGLRSAQRLNRSVFGQLTQKDFQKLHDTLYEDSRLSSIDTDHQRSKKH